MCSVTGSHMRSVALDEAHEMLVNKDLKTTIVRPTKAYLDCMLYYYPVRSMLQKAVKHEVLLDVRQHQSCQHSLFDSSPHSVRTEDNVKCMITKAQTSNSLEVSCENERLKSLSGQVASPEQQIDLVGFWEVGQQRLENQIKFFILKDPSTQAPRRKAKLLTFASSKQIVKKMKQLDREKRIVGRYLC